MRSNLAYNLSRRDDRLNYTSANLSRITKDNSDFVQRLANYKTLSVHNGCVNSITWNQKGNYILSGSDDHKLVITDPFKATHEVRVEYRTAHRSNIFCARFLPFTSDEKIISCSGDGVILVTDLQNTDSYINRYECHESTCYKLLPLDSYTFLSCSEDKTVRFYDIRMKQSCCCRVGPNNQRADRHMTKQIIKAPKPISAIARHPMRPHEIALGVANSSVYIHDRRMLDSTSEAISGSPFVDRLTVPAIADKHYRVTSVNYSANGSELVASFSSDHVYLFQLTNDSAGDNVRKFEDVRPFTQSASSQSLGSGGKKVKKIRLRGDWSDTGPNARPSAEGGNSEIGQARPTLQNSLMERMTLVLSQMLSGVNNASSSASALEQMGIENEQLNDLIDHSLQNSSANSASTSNTEPTTTSEISVPSQESLEQSSDMEGQSSKIFQRFTGHRNTRTMIKEVNFWGDEFIISGSDCGHIFFWNKKTSEIVNILEGDKHVVNNVQPHPVYPILATSGIDYDIKLWSPSSSESNYDLVKIQELVRRNELMLEETKDTITVPATFMIRMLSCLSHIRQQNATGEGASSSRPRNPDPSSN